MQRIKLMIRILFPFAFIISLNLHAQLNNEAFFAPFKGDTLEEKQFSLQLDHLNFLKNNEYFTKITDGRTLFGMHIIPKAVYQAHPKLRLEGGAFLWKDYGSKGFQQVEPVFTARFMAGTNQVLMGTLDGGLQHNLIEPLYDFENQLIRRLEYGFQWKHQSQKLKLDAWVDWRNMIYPNSRDQEQIVGGINAEPVLYEGNRTKVSLSFQGNVYHSGGQIDTSNLPLTTWFNGAAGFKTRTTPGNGIFLKYIELQAYMVGFKDNSTTKKFDFTSAGAAYINLSAKTRWVELMLSYWESKKIVSYQGGPLYRSISNNTKNLGYAEDSRQLIFIRILKDWEIMPNIWITARVEPYFDLKNNFWEFSHGLYINYKGELWKSKTKKM